MRAKVNRSQPLNPLAPGFVTNRRLLLSASDAFGRVMYSYKVRESRSLCRLFAKS